MSQDTLADLNRADEQTFVEELGGIYEHSPWVAERVVSERPFESVDALRAAMRAAVDDASEERQLALLRAHPDLGDQTGITDASESEQASAGLDQLSPELYETFQRLNDRYRERFGFPFIMAVKDESPEAIKEAMEQRIDNGDAVEFETALSEVHTIARFRLEERFQS